MTDRGADGKDLIGVSYRVRGLVQGVGFRPTVWRLARDCGLVGEVLNDGDGVLIRAWGREQDLGTFARRLAADPPTLARIDNIAQTAIDAPPPGETFEIAQSAGGPVQTGVVPDAATCPACLGEIMDPRNRRHRYPFTNCTHCGPRLTIIRAIPYDRAQTSMAPFPMCAACQAEYDDPADRRFHAQPNACAVCGPRVWLTDATGREIPPPAGLDPIQATAQRIANRQIVAVKGIGGFHLACDAADGSTVQRLRNRKRRYDKPFALMVRDMDMASELGFVGPAEAEALSAASAPIVVLDRRPDGPPLASAVAPGQDSIGLMLPYSPLHHLLMADLDGPIVLTSGNRSDEPQCIDNDEALDRLDGIADVWLMHDRDIINRVDDSVIRVAAGAARTLRRARGLAPAPLALPDPFAEAPRTLAMGGELKATFCMIKDGQAILSQHLGDLEDASVHGDYRRNLGLYRQLYEFDPATIAIDGHPDYLSSRWGQDLATESGAALETVQHHHAHAAACLAEHRRPPDAGRVLAVLLDGLGYGGDGGLWGGEFLAADYLGFERLGHFQAAPLIGGERAMREPWRNTLAFLDSCLGWDRVTAEWGGLAAVRALNGRPVETLRQMMATGLNSPKAVSAGRLFDAVAGALGICAEATTYEGQAAIELEALAQTANSAAGAYGFDLLGDGPRVIGWAPMWSALLRDLATGTAPAVIARRFHNGVAAAVARTALDLAAGRGLDTVVLSGGVFQNRLLLEAARTTLDRAGLAVLLPSELPANDGGLALGQAAVAAARALRRT